MQRTGAPKQLAQTRRYKQWNEPAPFGLIRTQTVCYRQYQHNRPPKPLYKNWNKIFGTRTNWKTSWEYKHVCTEWQPIVYRGALNHQHTTRTKNPKNSMEIDLSANQFTDIFLLLAMAIAKSKKHCRVSLLSHSHKHYKESLTCSI